MAGKKPNSQKSDSREAAINSSQNPQALGICLGASNITFVQVGTDTAGKVSILEKATFSHDGNPRKTMQDLFKSKGPSFFSKCAVTGRKFKSLVRFTSVSEPETAEKALHFVAENDSTLRDVNCIVSAGGETFMAYQLDESGRIINVYTGNKCASGTGEFFLQQMKRIDMELADAIREADTENPYNVAGRCSVFCKSDCTHALNKGIPKGRVVSGLCRMMSSKILELVQKIPQPVVLLAGGTSSNRVMLDFLEKSGLNVKTIEESSYFEALGAALWALNNSTTVIRSEKELFSAGASSFEFLPPLMDNAGKVEFKRSLRGTVSDNDKCIIGLDVGSTTTKAVLLRIKDDAILASCYLRTLGDPVGASRNCYRALADEISGTSVEICGLGVTGSGRQIAGLHALTRGVVNEIIAHATAAVHFDPKVDTIFEIGGQDAKYTYITNMVASDYAMNEACSAGTGSFLEESAKESLDIDTESIGDIAMTAMRPPNFNDQCAAFISSDIKSAIQEGISTEDILAGLVYSICMNYVNRVKGNRSVGETVFMQGGVCYNRAVPVAMAALTGKSIVVPPEPGLMGAFGVALDIKKKLSLGLLAEQQFDLMELSDREVLYKKPFVCGGGKEKCDRKCMISNIKVNDRIYPFGGACNKYYNLLNDISVDAEDHDMVVIRENMFLEKYLDFQPPVLTMKKDRTITVGISRSLLTNTLFPLYKSFFGSLGVETVMSDEVDPLGADKRGAAFCYPVEQSHGFLQNLLKKDFNVLFLPQVKGVPIKNGISDSCTCPFVQSEPYYLKTAFPELKGRRILSPVLDFSKGYGSQLLKFIDLGMNLGFTETESVRAYRAAVSEMEKCVADARKKGLEILRALEENPENIGVVVFGRPYNAFTHFGNMGIPHKFASRGITVIPMDFLPYEDEENYTKMYWSMGQIILKAARFVKKHPQLFGAYITNFSCGPDSFIVSYFRNIMGNKPSLTLELDSHTADAGVDTRIEAFMDVVKSFRELSKTGVNTIAKSRFRPATTHFSRGKGALMVTDSDGNDLPLSHPRVKLLLPTMGEISSSLITSAFRYIGIKAQIYGANTFRDLQTGRANASCKECLPLQVTVGKLLNYLEDRRDSNEILVYFMPETSGPCRFGQYNILIDELINRKQLRNVTTLSLTSENSYAGMGTKFLLRAWQATLVGDVLEDVFAATQVLCADPAAAREAFTISRERIIQSLSNDSWSKVMTTLKREAAFLKSLPRKRDIRQIPKVAIIGEIFVRRDALSRQFIGKKLTDKGILPITAPVSEWLYYCDFLVANGLTPLSKEESKLRLFIQGLFKKHYERVIKKAFTDTGLYLYHELDIDYLVNGTRHLLNPEFTGEAILTIGSAIHDMIHHVDGVVSIGPFGCMPNRISEAILSETINTEKKRHSGHDSLVTNVMKEHPNLPFLPIESDGNVFPQLIEAKFESFCLQVSRISETIRNFKKAGQTGKTAEIKINSGKIFRGKPTVTEKSENSSIRAD
jgi:predicted CoA-substrate-specific enzyme activase